MYVLLMQFYFAHTKVFDVRNRSVMREHQSLEEVNPILFFFICSKTH